MTVEYIRYRLPERLLSETFLDSYRRAAIPLAASPYCVDYELSQCAEDDHVLILRITWTSATDHLEKFRGSPEFQAFFKEIQPYVSHIEEMRHYEPTGIEGKGASAPSLYDWAGGAEAFGRLTETFYSLVLKDDLLAPLFADLPHEHAHHVALWLGEVFGGPAAYSEQHGGHAHMVGKHLGKGISEPQRRRWVNLIQDAADEAGLPTDAEFRSAFLAYIEWGTRLAVYFSGPNATRPAEQPVPHWNWGAMKPYKP